MVSSDFPFQIGDTFDGENCTQCMCSREGFDCALYCNINSCQEVSYDFLFIELPVFLWKFNLLIELLTISNFSISLL